jgi:hypothetical protein
MSVQSLETTRVPILGPPLESLDKKCHLDITPAKSHRIYYRERGASFQRLQAM